MANKTVKGLFWSSMERFSVQGVQFVLTLFIARILSPSDYGLIAMLGIFMAVAQSFIDAGFSNALIQKQDRNDTDYSTVFYFNIAVAVLIYGIIFFASPAIASFYNQPQLDSVAKVVSLSLIVSSFSTIQRAKLTIALDFKSQAIISLFAVIISGALAIYMAYQGFGVWTLVWQSLVSNTINTLLLWISAKWKPQLYFSMKSFRELFSFGSKLLASSLLYSVYTNLYTLCIGKFFSASELGYYNRASSIGQYVSFNLTAVITRVTYPIECELQNDNEALQKKYYSFIRMTAFIIFPLMIGLCVLAEPLVRVILTDKWLKAVPYLQILCFAYMWHSIIDITWSILNVKHRSDYALKSEIIKRVVGVIILVSTIPFGIIIMCIGLIVNALADLFIVANFTKRLIPEICFKNQVKVLFPILGLSLSMGVVIFIVNKLIESPSIVISIGVITAIVYYIIASYLFRFKEIEQLYILLIRKK